MTSQWSLMPSHSDSCLALDHPDQERVQFLAVVFVQAIAEEIEPAVLADTEL